MAFKPPITDPLEALRYVAWTEFKKVACQIEQDRVSYINRNAYTVMGRDTSPYRAQEERNQFLLDMKLEEPENLSRLLPPPPPPKYAQAQEMKKHRETFLRTFIRDDQKRLKTLIGHYDEEMALMGSDELWKSKELLSTRPSTANIPRPPKQDKDTHGRVLSYAWSDIGDDAGDLENDVSSLPPQLILSWMKDINLTITDQLASLDF